MSVDIRSSDRRRYMMNEIQAREKEIAAGLLKVSQPGSPKVQQESEKRIRREIANSNERRRMQCINAGFSSLRALIPQLEGEKLSKAAILQHTTDYISSLEKEKSRLQLQVDHTKHLLAELGQERMVTDAYISNTPPPSKRKKRDTESSDEGVGSLSDASDEGGSELRQENMALLHQLKVERDRCAALEERNQILESQLISVLQVRSAPPSTLKEMEPVKLETTSVPLAHMDLVYNREVVEVIASRDARSCSPESEAQNFWRPPLRPLTPTPECRVAMDVSGPLESEPLPLTVEPNSLVTSTVASPMKPDMEEGYSYNTHLPAAPTSSSPPPPPAVTASSVTPSVTSTTEGHIQPHHHNYCYRDHPRRRHRLQAKLDQLQADEELKRQQELQQQQQASAAAAACLPSQRGKPNTRNLENLVEAIRQIEGDRVLCQMEDRPMCEEGRLYEEEQRMYTKRQSLPSTEESERETSSISDMDELKSESSGRDSPLQQQQHHYHPRQSQHNSMSVQSVSSSFSEKYPIATHLLHRPLHPSFYRPGVIVHKQ